MAIHLAAYHESIDPSGVLTPIAAVPDQALTTSGDDITVPSDVPNISALAALTAAAGFVSAQVQAPSLRTLVNPDISPLVGGVVFGDPPQVQQMFRNPAGLVVAEDLNFYMQSTPGAGAESHYGLVWLSDGPVQPTQGEIFTVRCTAANSLAAGQWVNGNLTFTQTLPAGEYQVVGMRAEGTNLVAARIVFKGGSWRPGVPAVNAISDLDADNFRWGGLGVWGTFNETVHPTVECLGITDSSQTIYLDLIKTR